MEILEKLQEIKDNPTMHVPTGFSMFTLEDRDWLFGTIEQLHQENTQFAGLKLEGVTLGLWQDKLKEIEFLTADKFWLKDHVAQLHKNLQITEEKQKALAEKYVKCFISNLQLMDEVLPDWRLFAKEELEQARHVIEGQMGDK